MLLTKVKVEKILVADRVRNDFGEITQLAQNIDEVGLLQPPVVDANFKLIAGERRLRAVRLLEWDEVPVLVAESLGDALSQIKAEHSENHFRKEFTPSEKVRAAERIRAFVEAEAAERMKGGKKVEEAEPEAEGEVEVKKGSTRDILAEHVGLSGESYRKAAEVVAAAEGDPKLKDLVDKMDSQNNIHAAYKDLKKRQAEAEAPKEPKDKEKIVDANGTEVPLRSGLRDKFADTAIDSVYEALNEIHKALSPLAKICKEIGNANPWVRCTAAKDEKTPGIFEAHKDAVAMVKLIKESLLSAKPYVVCPKCSGKKCKHCRQSGFMPKWRFVEEEQGEGGEEAA